jgi:hypothetical protein
MCIEQQFERSPENEMLGTVEKNRGNMVHLKFFGESARVICGRRVKVRSAK